MTLLQLNPDKLEFLEIVGHSAMSGNEYFVPRIPDIITEENVTDCLCSENVPTVRTLNTSMMATEVQIR